MQNDNNTVCLRSDHEIVFRNLEGKIGLCCKMYPGADFLTNEIADIKTSLISGIKHPSCKNCWKYEENNNISWRQHGNEHYGIYKNKYQIELYFDNTCDAACIYCSRIYSSKWEQELKTATSYLPNWADRQDYPNNITNQYDKQRYSDYVFEYITNSAKNKKLDDYYEIILLGGEPLLTSINKKELLTLTIESFYKECSSESELTVIIQTNANTPKKLINSCIDKMKFYNTKYKNLKFEISISGESIGKNFEYIRYGISYDRFFENFNIWAGTGYVLSTNMAISAVSLPYLTNYFEMLVDIAQKNNTIINVSANMLYSPDCLNVKILDSSFKKHCKMAIEYVTHNTKYFKNSNDIVNKLKSITDDIGTDINLIHFYEISKFFNYVKSTRKLDIADVNIDLYKYVNSQLGI